MKMVPLFLFRNINHFAHGVLSGFAVKNRESKIRVGFCAKENHEVTPGKI